LCNAVVWAGRTPAAGNTTARLPPPVWHCCGRPLDDPPLGPASGACLWGCLWGLPRANALSLVVELAERTSRPLVVMLRANQHQSTWLHTPRAVFRIVQPWRGQRRRWHHCHFPGGGTVASWRSVASEATVTSEQHGNIRAAHQHTWLHAPRAPVPSACVSVFMHGFMVVCDQLAINKRCIEATPAMAPRSEGPRRFYYARGGAPAYAPRCSGESISSAS
jgi:hypothetical protein